jgi:hypothetical protein
MIWPWRDDVDDDDDFEWDGGERTKGIASPSSKIRCSGASVTTKESNVDCSVRLEVATGEVVSVAAVGGGDMVKSTALGGMVNPRAVIENSFRGLVFRVVVWNQINRNKGLQY